MKANGDMAPQSRRIIQTLCGLCSCRGLGERGTGEFVAPTLQNFATLWGNIFARIMTNFGKFSNFKALIPAMLMAQGGYSGFQVTGMIEGFFWVWNFRFRDFFGYEKLASIFLGSLIWVGFFGVLKRIGSALAAYCSSASKVQINLFCCCLIVNYGVALHRKC